MSVKELNQKLASLKEQHEKLKLSYATVNLSAGQNQCVMTVGGHKFDLTTLSRETGWYPKYIKGYEMVILGAKKALAASIESCEHKIAECKKEIVSETLRELDKP